MRRSASLLAHAKTPRAKLEERGARLSKVEAPILQGREELVIRHRRFVLRRLVHADFYHPIFRGSHSVQEGISGLGTLRTPRRAPDARSIRLGRRVRAFSRPLVPRRERSHQKSSSKFVRRAAFCRRATGATEDSSRQPDPTSPAQVDNRCTTRPQPVRWRRGCAANQQRACARATALPRRAKPPTPSPSTCLLEATGAELARTRQNASASRQPLHDTSTPVRRRRGAAVAPAHVDRT